MKCFTLREINQYIGYMLLAGLHRPILHKFSKNTTSSGGRNFSILSKSLSLSAEITTGLFNNVTLGKDLSMY